ncbi:hypothetical protein DPMN_087951 [Dreissena polymorpha]|uniref:Uncharacterized protein n=1 Tax=Dreissena polymorpha TaxID=45954 RepID=A0A9D4QXF3_DREPO|nr:hypothetical protein DPMN_087951 [Dreissena polymorpha]
MINSRFVSPRPYPGNTIVDLGVIPDYRRPSLWWSRVAGRTGESGRYVVAHVGQVSVIESAPVITPSKV